MQDRELYEHLFELKRPWYVSRVELNMGEQRVNVWVDHEKGWPFQCPVCQKSCGLYDHEAEREWRHLDTCQFHTYLYARIPRIQCSEHGVRQARVSWAEPRARFTLLFERFAIDVFRAADVSNSTRILRISWDEGEHLMRRAVERGLARREGNWPERIGIDEKSIARGQKYATVLCDLDRSAVIEVAEGRTIESCVGCLKALPVGSTERLKAIAMDMWKPYIQGISSRVPGGRAKIVFDRFHVMMHINNALDLIRRKENKMLIERGDDRLKGSKYLWLRAYEKMTEKQAESFESLRAEALKTSRAWSIKETLRGLWQQSDYWTGWSYLRRWHNWATHSRLEPIIKVARMIREHEVNILSYFEHPITNAVAEALNSSIERIKKSAYGFRNFGNFRIRVLFHCGGLSMYPSTHPEAG